jgi:hypothetical protein
MNFIVEHKKGGHYIMEIIRGVEDLDTSRFTDLLGIWVTDSEDETRIMEEQLKEMRRARSSQPS